MRLCGPKLSLCCSILSIWGIIQLVLMGFFFYAQCVTMVEDLPIHNREFVSLEDFYQFVEGVYNQNAYNCWIAAIFYAITLLVSLRKYNASRQATAK